MLRTVVFKHTKPEDSFDGTLLTEIHLVFQVFTFIFLGELRANCSCSNFSSVLIKKPLNPLGSFADTGIKLADRTVIHCGGYARKALRVKCGAGAVAKPK